MILLNNAIKIKKAFSILILSVSVLIFACSSEQEDHSNSNSSMLQQNLQLQLQQEQVQLERQRLELEREKLRREDERKRIAKKKFDGEKRAIKRVREEFLAFTARNEKGNYKTKEAATDALLKIDLTGCPADFRSAFTRAIRTMQEWWNLRDDIAIAKQYNSVEGLLIAGLIEVIDDSQTPIMDYFEYMESLEKKKVELRRQFDANVDKLEFFCTEYGLNW